MKIAWWKIAGIVLFVYVLIAGIGIPLKPGITDVSPSQLKVGVSKSIQITAYNTHFLTGGKTRVWLKREDNKYLEASEVQVNTENLLQASWSIPVQLINKEFSIVVHNAKDGPFVVPAAVVVLPDSNSASFVTPVKFTDLTETDLKRSDDLRFPYRSILNETIRNTFFHVALWMAMFVLYLIALYHAIQYLRTGKKEHDWWSVSFNRSGILYGILGLLTGSLWARYTWGGWWTNDVKLNMAALAMFIYFGYLLLRSSFNDDEKKARVSAAFNIFAFVALIPLVFVIPRLTDSLHPGNGGNPALGGEDLDHTLRLVFYPSIIALILLGTWMAQLRFRMIRLAARKKIHIEA
ncbi:MAG: cytochrome c biogenesis protein CcsA [Saprospiraceae bacterium]|nr:cytochrome c biogenesis protein CcsA [Saprospiraceae bacterium]